MTTATVVPINATVARRLEQERLFAAYEAARERLIAEIHGGQFEIATVLECAKAYVAWHTVFVGRPPA